MNQVYYLDIRVRLYCCQIYSWLCGYVALQIIDKVGIVCKEIRETVSLQGNNSIDNTNCGNQYGIQ